MSYGASPMAERSEPLALQSPVWFGLRMVLLMFCVKILIVVPPVMFGLPGKHITEGVVDAGVGAVIASFTLLPIETLLGQALPIWVLKKRGVSRWLTLSLVSAAWFGCLHLFAGPFGFLTGFAGGTVLSYSWLSWRKGSFALVFVGTTSVHAMHNALSLLVFLLVSAVQ
jgi:hypothetical protein